MENHHFQASNVSNQVYGNGGDWRLEKRGRHHIPRSCMLSSSPVPPVSSWNVHSDHSIYRSKRIFNDSAEARRQKRVVKYKAYAVEGKMKISFRSGLRWVKDKYCSLMHRY